MNRREAIAALTALPAVARISRGDVRPTDVLVVECDGRLSVEAMMRIKAVMGQIWPGQRCVVLDAGTRLRVVDGGQLP